MKQRTVLPFMRMLLALLVNVLAFSTYAQPPGTVSPTITRNGYSLQKSTSLSSVRTNDPFTYTITFCIPAGATSVTVSDIVPAPLVIDAVIVPAGGYSGNIPSVSTAGNTVSISFASVPTSICGSFQINVHFPVEHSCNNLDVRNNARLTGKTPDVDISTEYVLTRAIVNNPWRIQKYPTAPWVSPCPYGSLSDTVEYNVRIAKTWNMLAGSASLYTVSLFDILPAGATVLPTTYSSSVNMSPSSISAAGVITLPGAFNLSATTNPLYTAKFKVVFAPQLDSLCTINTFVLQGKYDCNGTPSPLYSDTTRIGIQKFTPAPNGMLQKWYSVTGNVPGCTGTYYVRVCNQGTAPLNGYTLSDTFPSACLTGVTTTYPAGCLITGGPSVYTITGDTLPAGQCHTYTFNFTIGIGCPGPITNKVVVTSGFTSPPRSSSIYLLPNDATPCVTKSICGPNSATIGSLIRFRIRVQNIGGTPIINAHIFDTLDNPNLEYQAGSEMYYRFPNAGAPCSSGGIPPAGSSPWTGISVLHNIPLGQLHWKFDTIGVTCGNVPYPVCGYAGNLPAYYIEFTVKVRDTAGLGNLRNITTVSGGNITTPATNYVTFVVNGTLNYSINKTVSSDGGGTFGPSATANAGALVQYRLGGVNSGIPLVSPMIIDLLPRDNGGSDNYILNAAARGSNYDIRYNSLLSSSHTVSSSLFSTNVGITTFPELGYTVGGGVQGWGAAPVGAANFKTYFSQAFGIAPPFAYVIDAKTDPSAQDGDVACNTFAIRGYAKYIINYLTSFVQQPPLESGRACVTIERSGCCEPYGFDVPKEVCLGITTKFCVLDSCKEPGNDYHWVFGDGTTGSGKCVTHAYGSPGGYTVTVYWTDECGDHKKEFHVEVKECPCDIKVCYTIEASGLTITGDASCTTSSLPIAVYVWEFGDGTVGTGQIVTHTYATGGTYTVRLRVYALDANGDICKCVKECKTDIRVDKDREAIFHCPGRGGPIEPEDPQEFMKRQQNSNIVLKAAPNPFTARLSVSVDFIDKTKQENVNNFRLELTNVNGTVLQQKPYPGKGSNVVFETGGYAAGNYFVMLKTATGQIQSLKVVKIN